MTWVFTIGGALLGAVIGNALHKTYGIVVTIIVCAVLMGVGTMIGHLLDARDAERDRDDDDA